jgi:hypothetical protein
MKQGRRNRRILPERRSNFASRIITRGKSEVQSKIKADLAAVYVELGLKFQKGSELQAFFEPRMGVPHFAASEGNVALS